MAAETATASSAAEAVAVAGDALVARVAAYLRAFGLPQGFAEGQAEAVVESVIEAGVAPEQVLDAAIEHVGRQFNDWLAWLASEGCAELRGEHVRLACAVRPVLRRHPELFLRRDTLPLEILEAVRVSACTPTPEEEGTVMPVQQVDFARLTVLGAIYRILTFDLKGVFGRVHRAFEKSLEKAN